MHYAVVRRPAKLTAQHRVIFAIPYNAMQYDAMQYHAMQSKTIQYMQYKEIPCNTLFKSFETSTGPMGFVFSSWMVPYGPVLKIKYHGYHGRGTKGIWGDQRDVYCFFCENIWETFWSSQNLYSVPLISVYGPH